MWPPLTWCRKSIANRGYAWRWCFSQAWLGSWYCGCSCRRFELLDGYWTMGAPSFERFLLERWELTSVFPPQPDPHRIQPHQQQRIVPSNVEVGFAGAPVAQAKGKRNLGDRMDAATYQHLQQQLEAGALKCNLLQAFAPDQKEAGHRVFRPQPGLLQGPCHPHCCCRQELSHRIPVAQIAARRIAAANRNILAFLNGRNQTRQQLRRVLQIGVHHAQNRGIRVLPAMQNCAGQSPLPLANQQANAWIFKCDG